MTAPCRPRWLALALTATLSACAGSPGGADKGDATDGGPDGTAADAGPDGDAADGGPDGDAADTGPLDFGPQTPWDKPDGWTGPDRILAPECWLLPFLPEPGEIDREFQYAGDFTMAADVDRVYVITGGSVPNARTRAEPTNFFLHAVDADGVELWRTGIYGAEAPVAILVADAGDVIVVFNDRRLEFGWGGFVDKVSRDGDILWYSSAPGLAGVPQATGGIRGAPALDEDGNVYVNYGTVVSSLSGLDGSPRWSRAMPDDACDASVWVDLVVVGDVVWAVSACGVFAWARDGTERVALPRTEWARPAPGKAAVLTSGELVIGRGGALERLTASGEVADHWDGLDASEGSDLLVAPDDTLVVVRSGSASVMAGGRVLWTEGLRGDGRDPIIDDRGQLVTGAVDLRTLPDGELTGPYDRGRRSLPSTGVVLRAGQLIAPTYLYPVGAPEDGHAIAALQCVALPVGLPAPNSWSRRHGDQQNRRRWSPAGGAGAP